MAQSATPTKSQMTIDSNPIPTVTETPVSTSSELAQDVSASTPSKANVRRSQEGVPIDIDLNKPGTGHPYSCFYQHPALETHAEKAPSRTSFDKDVEKGLLTPLAPVRLSTSGRSSFEPSYRTPTTQTNKSSTSFLSIPFKQTSTNTSAYKDGISVTVWPTCSEMRQRKKEARRMKSCLLFRNLSKKQKIIAKILVLILVLGIAATIGCVISYFTGGLVWHSANGYGKIG